MMAGSHTFISELSEMRNQKRKIARCSIGSDSFPCNVKWYSYPYPYLQQQNSIGWHLRNYAHYQNSVNVGRQQCLTATLGAAAFPTQNALCNMLNVISIFCQPKHTVGCKQIFERPLLKWSVENFLARMINNSHSSVDNREKSREKSGRVENWWTLPRDAQFLYSFPKIQMSHFCSYPIKTQNANESIVLAFYRIHQYIK